MEVTGALPTDPRAFAPDAEARLGAARRAAESGDAREAAREFETLLAVQLVRELRRALPDGLFGKGAGADVYEGWFDEHLGRALAERDALGFARVVEAALTREHAGPDADAPAASPAETRP